MTLTITAGRSAKFVGPTLGGLAIAHLGVASPFLLNAASFVVLMAAVVGMRGVAASIARTGTSFVRELTEGFRHIRGAPVLSGILKLEIIFSILQMNEVMITIVGRELLRVGPAGLGLLLSAPALGSIIGVVSLLLLGQPRRQGRFVVYCMLAYVAALVAVAVSPGYAFSFVALAFTGFLDSLVTVTRHSIMQLAAPRPMRGRVMANMGTVTNGIGPLAQVQSGLLAEALGPPLAIVTAAAGLAVAALVTSRASPTLWNFTHDDAATERPASLASPPPPA